MALSQFDERNPYTVNGQLLAADTTGFVVIVNNVGAPIRLDRMLLSNSDTIPHVVELAWNDGFGDVAPLGAISVPAGAGFTAACIEFLSAVMPAQQQFFIVPNGVTLQFKTTVAMVGGSHVDILVIGGTF